MNLAIITARGGSKGFPGKNLAELHGLPLIAWTIRAVLDSRVFDQVCVSSDNQKILDAASEFGARALKRPSHLATDTALSFDAYMHAVTAFESFGGSPIEYAGLFQPTSPLRGSWHIRGAYEKLITTRANGIVSVHKPTPHPMKAFAVDKDGFLKGLYSSDAPYLPRQQLPDYCYANGAIYIYRRSKLEGAPSFPEDKILSYEMSERHSIDIDSFEDLTHAEAILEQIDADLS